MPPARHGATPEMTMATTTRVSAIVPVHNAAGHLAEALDSLAAQDWPDLEVVAVDDGSTDASPAILAETAADWARAGRTLRVISQRNRGAGAARDAGIAAAAGAAILLADADDRCDRGLVTALMATLAETGADLAAARCRYIDASGRIMAVQAPQTPHPTPLDLLNGMMVNTPLIRREALAAVGGHDATLPGSIDLDLIVRLALRRPGALAMRDAVLSDYRRGGGQITSDWRRMEASWMRVRDKALAAGLDVSAGTASAMRGRHCAYWATLAYMAGDHAAARRLIVEALRRVPSYVARDDLARIRLLACLASLLPAPLHDRIRARFNARKDLTT